MNNAARLRNFGSTGDGVSFPFADLGACRSFKAGSNSMRRTINAVSGLFSGAAMRVRNAHSQ
jgi:hypothetical protein